MPSTYFNFICCTATFIKTDILVSPCHLFPLLLTVHEPPLFLQSQGSRRLGSNADLSFALIKCRSIVNKLSQLKSFDASANLDIIFIAQSWLKEDTPNSVISLV